jgi:magnesium transporter
LTRKLENWEPADVARLITTLPGEDQVIVFILPRGLAADVFEYFDQIAQESVLKTMAQDDVTALSMTRLPMTAPICSRESPAAVTKQLLALLTPEERTVAISLLGYPEDSIGRLMTPDYVSVRQNWTIEQVLAHIRTHGRDSETLSAIYVVDKQGVLLDSLRIQNSYSRRPLRESPMCWIITLLH